MGTTLQCAWDVGQTYASYLARYSHVSASCRLTMVEELTLLYECDPAKMELQVSNRLAYLQSLDEGRWGGVYSVSVPARPVLENEFDLALDKSCLDTLAYENPFTTTSYTRPEEKDGAPALALANRWINEGFRLKGSKNNLGFVSPHIHAYNSTAQRTTQRRAQLHECRFRQTLRITIVAR
jgi:hypothetical protein